MTKRLIKSYENMDMNALPDILMVAALNVETSLIQAGATAGEDYSYMDLFNLAQPYALEIFNKNDSATIIFN